MTIVKCSSIRIEYQLLLFLYFDLINLLIDELGGPFMYSDNTKEEREC